MSNRLKAWLLHPRFSWFLAIVAFLVHTPTLRVGYLIDDLPHRYFAQGHPMPGGPRGFWDLYRFADGGPGTREALELGIHPWWADPGIKLAFFRPVTSTLRYLEEVVFGAHAIGPHLVSCLLFVGLTLAVLQLFREWIGGAAASLAALLFAIDDAHATTVVWIAARHTMLATLFVVLGLTAFLRARKQGVASPAAAVFFALGLASSEAALGGLAYFAALAFVPAPRADVAGRVRALAPIAAVTLVWMVLYVTLGYGARGSAFYVDPATSPGAFLQVAFLRAPVLALAQLFVPPAEVASMVPHLLSTLAITGAILVTGFIALSVRVLGATRVIPLAFAFLVSLVPACGTSPDDRLLVLPGVAAFGLLGLWARHLAHRPPSLGKKLAIAAGTLVHVVFAVVLLPARALFFGAMFGAVLTRGEASFPRDDAFTRQDLIIVTAPDGLLPGNMGLIRILASGPIPLSTRILVGSPASPATVTRTAEDTLEISVEGGSMLDPFVRAYTSQPFRAGQRVDLRALSIEVLAVRDGHPTAYRFVFHRGISAERQRFVAWKGHGFEQIAIPPVGESIVLPAVIFDDVLAGPR